MCCRRPLRDPARGDVLHLEDEAGRVFVGGGEERRVQRDRDEVAVGARAAKLERAGGRRARDSRFVELGRERRVVVAMDEFAEVGAHQLVAGRAEDLAQRGIRLQDDALVSDERHADRGVSERFLEPALALLQLGQVARRLGGLALGGGDALLLGELGVLDVAQVQAVRQDDARDHRQRREEDADAQALVAR